MISTKELRRLPLDVQLRRLFSFLYSRRVKVKGGVDLWVVWPDAVHRRKCPLTVAGRKHGPCDCLGDRIQRELDRILHSLKKSCRFNMRDVRKFEVNP